MTRLPDRRRAIALAYGLAAGIVTLDQFTKALILEALGAGQPPIVLIPGVLELRFGLNTGMAFSLLTDASTFLAIVASVVSMGLIVFNYRLTSTALLPRLALGLLLGGALGNLIDRLRFGAVVDFIYVRLINYPAFNVADSALTIGVILAAWVLSRPAPEHSRHGESAQVQPRDTRGVENQSERR